MADEASASASASANPAPEGAKKGLPAGMIGVIGGVVVLVALGIGAVIFIKGMFKESEAGDKEAGHDKKEEHGEGLLESSFELQLGDLISNVKGKDARRYVKVTCTLRIDHKYHDLIIPPTGGGEHGGGGNKDEGGEVKRLIRMRLEGHLKKYDIEQLNSEDVIRQLSDGFSRESETQLHDLYKSVPPTEHFVKAVILNNLLLQ